MWISSIQNLISRKFTFKKSLCDFSVQREFHQTNQELKGFLKGNFVRVETSYCD